MTKTVSQLQWQQTSEKGDYVCSVACDAATDNNWNIALSSNVQLETYNVIPRFVVVDNYANNGTVQITYGPFTWTVGQFERKTFALPIQTSAFKLAFSTGIVTVTFAERFDLLPDAANQFSIQSQAGLSVVYTTVTKTNSGNQLATDGNKQIEFIPTVADITYTLQGIAATPIPDGWFNPDIRNNGTFATFLKPAAGETINGIYTNANPMRLNPGDSGSLMCNGGAWKFKGKLSFESAEITPLAGNTVTPLAHGFIVKPDWVESWVRCKVAQHGWAVGNEFEYGWGRANNGPGQSNLMAMIDATNVNHITSTGTFPLVTTAGAYANMTAANWAFFVRAYKLW